jgi:GTPase SAR1 family protein
VGFEFFTFNIKIKDKIIKLQIWDTCGQEIYRSLVSNFYRNSSLAVIVYAINE